MAKTKINWPAEIQRMRMQVPLPDAKYYAVFRGITASGELETAFITEWCGFTATRPMREIRRAREVDPRHMLELFDDMEQPGLLVNNHRDIVFFIFFGGNAVIEAGLGERFFKPNQPSEVFRHSSLPGYAVVRSEQNRQRAPSRKMRMKVLTRDKMRCTICGRSPANHIDVELDVHHVIPWGQGGITEEENLLTLCSACHDGLEPHDALVLPKLLQKIAQMGRQSYVEGLLTYQAVMRNLLAEVRRGSQKKAKKIKTGSESKGGALKKGRS